MTPVSGGDDGGFNVWDETTCATAPKLALASTDAQLDPAGPADNGGPTDTIALLPGSPAIDLVPVSSGLCPATDQRRGVTRPVDGDDNGTAACDTGAYEAPRPPDVTNPVVTVPANITVPATGPSPARPSPAPAAPANDDRDGPLTPTCTPASGSTFPVGTTTVTCTATDAAGNTGTGGVTTSPSPQSWPTRPTSRSR